MRGEEGGGEIKRKRVEGEGREDRYRKVEGEEMYLLCIYKCQSQALTTDTHNCLMNHSHQWRRRCFCLVLFKEA